LRSLWAPPSSPPGANAITQRWRTFKQAPAPAGPPEARQRRSREQLLRVRQLVADLVGEQRRTIACASSVASGGIRRRAGARRRQLGMRRFPTGVRR
jgi:hypothetical protein